MSDEQSASQGMSLARRIPTLPAAIEWQTIKNMAAALFDSGLLPKSLTNPYAALAIIEKGRELGIPPMMALNHINMIEGKPAADAQIMAGLIYRDHGDDAFIVIESTDERATIQYKRRGWSQPQTTSFTIDEAKRAGLLNKQNWQKYPSAMLVARCTAKVGRMAFQDTIGGMYTPEELDGDESSSSGRGTPFTITEIEPQQVQAAQESAVDERTVVDGEYSSADALLDMANSMDDTMPPSPSEVADLRKKAIARYHQLAAYAEDIEHPAAGAIKSKKPEEMNNPTLRAALAKLTALLPEPLPADPALEEQAAFV